MPSANALVGGLLAIIGAFGAAAYVDISSRLENLNKQVHDVKDTIEESVGQAVDKAVEESVGQAVEERLAAVLDERLEESVGQAVDKAVEESVGQAVEERLAAVLDERLEGSVGEAVGKAVEEQLAAFSKELQLQLKALGNRGLQFTEGAGTLGPDGLLDERVRPAPQR